MAHIQDRPGRDKRWRVRYRGPDGRERSRSFRRKVDAERFAATVEADKARGSWVDPARGAITFAAFVEGVEADARSG
jgi:hypothetical protein